MDALNSILVVIGEVGLLKTDKIGEVIVGDFGRIGGRIGEEGGEEEGEVSRGGEEERGGGEEGGSGMGEEGGEKLEGSGVLEKDIRAEEWETEEWDRRRESRKGGGKRDLWWAKKAGKKTTPLF